MSTTPQTRDDERCALLVRLPRDLRDALKAHAEANERSQAATVRRAIRFFLEIDGAPSSRSTP